MYALADFKLPEGGEGNELTDGLVDKYIGKIYAEGWDMEKMIPEVYVHNAMALMGAVKEGYAKEFFGTDWTTRDNNLLNRVQNTVFAFSGAKTYAEMQELRDAVYEGGKRISPAEFRRRALKINTCYNLQYLEVEREQVILGATQASHWLDFEETADTHPYLEYCTARDSHLREEHRGLDGLIFAVDDDFWKQYYPPNGWRCRCTVRKRTRREYEHLKKNYENRTRTRMPEGGEAQRIAGQVVAKPFRHNVGTSEIFDRSGHPYFRANRKAKEMQLSAVKHYGMKSVKDIYDDAKKLSAYKKEIADEKDYREYWQILESHYGNKDEGFTLVDRKRNISAYFDSKLKEKIGTRERFEYFDELIEVFEHPDEIWGNFQGSSNRRFGEEFFNVYVKYYKDAPIILLIDRDGLVNSFYRWERGKDDFEKFRTGLLKKKR